MRGRLLVGGILADQFLPGELISEGDDLELPVVADDHVADVEVVKLDVGVLDLLEEDFLVLDIVLHGVGGTISICWAGTK
jgi:hypothetical protein